MANELNENDRDRSLELVIALKQKNIDILEKMLLDRSTPGSPQYQKWLTFDSIGDYISNIEAERFIHDWVVSL